MNLFSGMSNGQVTSALVMIALVSIYVVLLIVALAEFYFMAKPSSGQPRVAAAAWALVAVFFLLWATIACVWSAPAEVSLIDPAGKFFDFGYQRFMTVILSVGFAGVGVLGIGLSLLLGLAEKKRQAASGAAPDPAARAVG